MKLQTIEIILALATLILCFGCTAHRQTYGVRAPAFQSAVYYPMEDPLFKNDK